LAELCENPEVTQAEVKDFNKRWTTMLDGLKNKKNQVEEVKQKMEELKTVMEPVEEILEQAQPILEAPTSYGADVKKSEDELKQIEVDKYVFVDFIYIRPF
jgi:thiamine kinase-like enzyme